MSPQMNEENQQNNVPNGGHDGVPDTPPTPRSLSQLIEDTLDGFSGETVSFSAIASAFHERGFGMLLMILSAPMALPLPVPPGVNIILATPLLFLTAQQMAGARVPWFPQFILNKTIKRSMFEKTMRAVLPWIRRIENLSRPRFGFITQGVFSHLIGLCGLVMAISVCVPLPLTNSVPSLGICLMSIGVLMRDGLAVVAGMCVGLGWIALLLILGEAGIRYAVSFVTG